MPAPGEHHPAFEEYCECIFELHEDDVEVIQARIAERLNVSRPAVSEMIRRLAAILAADVVGYSALMGADQEGTLAALRQLRAEVFGPAVAGHRGKLVKSMGDGWLVEFASAVDAVTCAMQLQDRLAATVGGALGASSDKDATPVAPTENPYAYELYLRAVDRMSHPHRWDPATATETSFPPARTRSCGSRISTGTVLSARCRWSRSPWEPSRSSWPTWTATGTATSCRLRRTMTRWLGTRT